VDIHRIAIRIASNSWFHASQLENLDKIIAEGLKASDPGSSEHNTGHGVYLTDSFEASINYASFMLDIPEEDLIIIEVIPPGDLLMDEDDIGPNGEGPSDEFRDEMPEAASRYDEIINEVGNPNRAKVQVIDELGLPPADELVYQGGFGGKRARFPGDIPVSNIIKICRVFDGGCYPVYPPEIAVTEIPEW
jgi:hypothetical protein